MKQVAYVNSDKYVLAEDYFDVAPFAPPDTIHTSYGTFYPTGQYKVSKGFLFSANFPAVNTEDSRRASMVHDFFYLLMKDKLLSRDYRDDIDYHFYDMLITDGMIQFRALYWYKAVRIGGTAALNSPRPMVRYAPSDTKLPPGHNALNSLKLG